MIAWLAHLYTALGAPIALAATLAVIQGEFRAAFLWLALAVLIDTTDGVLARGLRVKERLPEFDGGKLDDIIDYLTYVFVPVLLMLRAGLLPDRAGLWVAALVLLASAYGFSQAQAKVREDDYFFVGFPSYWNIVAVYLFVWRLPPEGAALILTVLALLVFVPIRYVYPSRTTTWQGLTIALGALWAVAVVVAIWQIPQVTGPWLTLSVIFPIYYTALSLWLHLRSRQVQQ